MVDIEQRDRELLNALQGDIPLVSTPFAVLGQLIDMSEKEVIKRTERLKREGFLKQLSALFDMRALGYRSCLVAARVAAARIDEAAAIINGHPGVTQNYRRNNDFNLWFTVAVAPSSKIGLEKTITVLGAESECDAVRSLPTLKLYKSTASDTSDSHAADGDPHGEYTPLTATEVECVRILQRDLPLQPRPFEALGRTAGIGGDDLLSTAKALLTRGQMRRFGATVQSRKGGFSASAMAVWFVPEDQTDEYGARLSQHRAVSHCYLRPMYDDWKYNIYTTVHGRSVDECESIINDLAADTGLTQKQALYPTKEYKKVRLNFFSRDAEEWESARVSQRAATAAS